VGGNHDAVSHQWLYCVNNSLRQYPTDAIRVNSHKTAAINRLRAPMNSGRILHHLNTRLRHCPPGRTRWALVCTTPRATYSLSDTVTPAVYNLSAYERPFGDNTPVAETVAK